MPFESPSLLTQTGNAKNLYLLASEGNIPDPLIVNDLVVTNESTITSLNVDNVKVSSGIITLSDTLGNQTLQATGADLFFDGQLLAKAGDIQNISDWADYPAIASVDVDTKGINNAGTISFGDTVNTLAVDVSNNLTYNGSIVNAGTPVADWANSPAVAVVNVNNKGVNQASSISFGNAINTLTTDVSNNLTYNGSIINAGGGSVSDWASFPASTNVNMNNKNINSNGTSLGIQNDRGGDILGGSQINLVAKNGLGGSINLTADTGYLGTSFGAVNIVANGGTTAGVGTGGLIQLTANTPFPDLGATSAIKFSASGINSYAGAIPSIGSVAGFNFIYGQGGVNICSGLPSALLSHPLVTYIYGTNGIELNSDVYTTKIFPYWDGGTFDIPDLEISGRDAFPGLNSGADVKLSHVTNLDMKTGAITGVSTINGSAYPPASGGVTSLNTLSGAVTITAGTNISLTTVGNNITVNQINTPVTNRASLGAPILITATTSGTAQTIVNLSLTTTAIYDIAVFAVSTITTSSNSRHDLTMFITIDGVQVGNAFTSTLNGIGHFLSFPAQCTQLGSTASAHTILLKAYADTASVLTVNNSQLTGIGNLA
jgi:hypothetical protein